MASGSKKKIAVAGIASILLVAAVVGTVVAVTKKSSNGNGSASSSSSTNGGSVSASTKAVQQLCQPTDYKKACEDALSQANSTNPLELVKVAFDVTVKNIVDAIQNSTLLKDAAKDERTKGALHVCEEVLNTAIEDLERSFEKVKGSSGNIGDYVNDVKTWLSGAITYQETCIDAFENTTGETGEKMKKLLKTAGELTSNGLAIVTDLSNYLSGFQALGDLTSRRLLQNNPARESDYPYSLDPDSDESRNIPTFVGANARKLMSSQASSIKANAVVAQDGSGNFKTISDAIKSIPPKNNQTFVIHVKAGVYKEYVIIPKRVNNVVLIGDGPLKTRITGNKNYADGVQTFHSATLAVNGENFIAKDIGIENTAGPSKHQAVAVRVSGDKAVFYNVHMDGFQDTLYAHAYRQYYRECSISGTIDFIFGDAQAVFQKCRLVVRKPMDNQACMVTAQGRKDRRSVGATIIQNCDIVAEPDFIAAKPALKAYLGRPWKEYSRTIIMHSNIDGFIAPEGWSPWMGTFGLNTLYYAEYENKGAGSNQAMRVKWKGIQHITPETAQSFTPEKLYVNDDQWIKNAGVSYTPGFLQA